MELTMKSKYILGIVLLLQILACGNGYVIPRSDNTETAPGTTTGNTASPTAVNTASSPTIGTVSNIRTQVYAGAPDNLKLIKGESKLGNEDFVTVADGGKARLIFPGPISLLLYNQSEMDGIKMEFENNSNPRIVNRLIRGGFSGYVEPGNHLTINLAFGIQVNVLGTNFFVLYDDKNGFVTIGKFDGSLSVSIPGQDTFPLGDSELIDVNSKGELTRYSSLPFTPAQFDIAADACVTPTQGFNRLRRDNKIPQPGESAFQKNINLPCGPLPPLTPTPEAKTCDTPSAFVKALTVQLREGPDLRFLPTGEYKQFDELSILGRYQGWYQVKFPDGNQGWLYTDWINIPPGVDAEKICETPYQGEPPAPQREDDPVLPACSTAPYCG
jgi:hypothetical protein